MNHWGSLWIIGGPERKSYTRSFPVPANSFESKSIDLKDFFRNRDVEETLSKTADFGCNEKYDKLELRNRFTPRRLNATRLTDNSSPELWQRRFRWRRTWVRMQKRMRRRTEQMVTPRSLTPLNCATGSSSVEKVLLPKVRHARQIIEYI